MKMHYFRVLLSFIVCGWVVLIFDLLGKLSFRLCDDFAKLALIIVGPIPDEQR